MAPKTEKAAEKTPAKEDAFDDAIETLQRMKQAEVIDEKILDELNESLAGLSDEGRSKFMDLPVVQKILERASNDAVGTKTPGTVVRIGGEMGFSFKVPYSLKDVYEKWPVVDSYVPDSNHTVVTPGGWVFRLTEGLIYDIPQGEPCPEDHGYKLPCIVVDIINQSKIAARAKKRETETRPFGMGVQFLETGWAGKAEVAKSDPKGHDSSRDQ